MDAVRALAVKMEEEDRSEVAHYMATILQKLANMNELFLGEKVAPLAVLPVCLKPEVGVHYMVSFGVHWTAAQISSAARIETSCGVVRCFCFTA